MLIVFRKLYKKLNSPKPIETAQNISNKKKMNRSTTIGNYYEIIFIL